MIKAQVWDFYCILSFVAFLRTKVRKQRMIIIILVEAEYLIVKFNTENMMLKFKKQTNSELIAVTCFTVKTIHSNPCV